MDCLLAIFAGLFPRMGLFIVWVARPALVDAAFETWIWPFLGFLFLPFTTLMYVILWRSGGLGGWDWLWIGVAVLFDLGHWGASVASRR
jgi:hypothetical protein